ncbi:Serine/threonine-protein kinase, active site [Sesbania bispinosa]|nr:Serine/threonine-protein kinase, active site [Sesbania bispinosa]
MRVIKDVASAVLYLHEGWEAKVVHRDIKASNVLLDKDMNGRLGDFGLAKMHSHGQISSTSKLVGTVGYMAPEGKIVVTPLVLARGCLWKFKCVLGDQTCFTAVRWLPQPPYTIMPCQVQNHAWQFGEEAWEATEHVFATAGHAVNTAWNVSKIRKAINPVSSAATAGVLRNSAN